MKRPITILICFGLLLVACGERIEPGKVDEAPGLDPPTHTGTSVRERGDAGHGVLGTLRSRREATISSRITAGIEAIHVEAGRAVDVGTMLATLDQRENEARFEQARSGLHAVQAEGERARLDHQRISRLLAQDAATPSQAEAAKAAFTSAEAQVAAAEQRLREAQTALTYTRIASPIRGVVSERLVEPGDMAWPGKPLFIVHDPADLRLEAAVREELVPAIELGAKVEVSLASLGRPLEGVVDEIAPAADPRTRTVLVKVAIPSVSGVFPGMFGHLLLRSGKRESVFAPIAAVRGIGQLRTVMVLEGDRWTRRYVTLGRDRGNRVEVLSGLEGGEILGWNEE